ncbi:flagellar biosynthesis repressor FlbT [Marinivivus vitaminiproducens]|uniref:flagellar biosynthesis repressor FlbT n=1 Tax=Marinivivus vitaminiproducens TaxID=3035935 RepID=UPI00279C374C|nr:flagellar biosynthesis repressor FlbT [Geminicoccaceae bacterium SCSIO 64248]
MAGLKLKLGPHERLLINGALIENGRGQVELQVLTPNTAILRLRDALHPEQVDTPTKRACYLAQLVVAGNLRPDEALPQFEHHVRALRQAFADPGCLLSLDQALRAAREGDFYRAMRAVRRLLPHEAVLMRTAVASA